MASDPRLEVLGWNESGYQPLVFASGWQVALLNWEPLFDPGSVGQIERHNETDEVFVLLSGRAALLVVSNDGLHVEDMQPGLVYNVRKGTWHNLISTRAASWLIVEDRDTHLHDCEYRELTGDELAALNVRLPGWVA